MIHLPLITVLGACFGSFFNVCIYRIPLGLGLSRPESHCYRCGTPVRWHDNIPLLSYWILRGRCRHCGAGFSMRYFLVELLTAGLFLHAYLVLGPSPALLPALVFLSFLIIATFTDIDHWFIPDRISLGGLVTGIVFAAAWPLSLAPGSPLAEPLVDVPGPWEPLAASLIGAAVGYGSLWLIGRLGALLFRKEAMGMGDMKLFAMFGAFMGPLNLLYVLILSCLIGTVAGLAGILWGKLSRGVADPAVAPLASDALAPARHALAHPLGLDECAAVSRALSHPGSVGQRRHYLPFGPSLALGAWIVYLWHEPLERWLTRLVLGDTLPY